MYLLHWECLTEWNLTQVLWISGAAFGDRNGYTLTFDGLEPIPFAFLEDYTTNPWDNGAFVNVSGTFPTTS